MFTPLKNKVFHCTGNMDRVGTFEKLVYIGEDLGTAKDITDACDMFRSRFHNDNVIIQCCAKGFVDMDDFHQLMESHCGIIKEPVQLRRYIDSHEPHRILWGEFVKYMRLGI